MHMYAKKKYEKNKMALPGTMDTRAGNGLEGNESYFVLRAFYGRYYPFFGSFITTSSS